MKGMQVSSMRGRRSWVAIGAGAALTVIALLVPLGSAASVAQVAGSPITLTEYRDWLGSAAASAHASDHSLPPFAPDAPRDSRCVAFERTATASSKSRPSTHTLQGACRLL